MADNPCSHPGKLLSSGGNKICRVCKQVIYRQPGHRALQGLRARP